MGMTRAVAMAATPSPRPVSPRPSVVLAETLGSMAGYLCTEGEQQVVGLEVNANHLRSARDGEVRGICRAVHIGRRHQVWQIEIFDVSDRLCCTSRLTTAVITP